MGLRTILIILIGLFLAVPVLASSPESGSADLQVMTEIRNKFYLAIDSDEETINLINFIQNKFSDDFSRYPPLIQAYAAALQGLRGKHAPLPLTKFVFVKGSILRMNYAVERQPDNLESRFLRFAFYQQIPEVFGVKLYVKPDLAAVMDLLEKRNCDFVCGKVQKDMIAFILKTNEPDPEQREKLEELYGYFSVLSGN